MSHPSARLTPFSRQVLVNRVLVEGWPAAEVARQFHVSRSTAYKWLTGIEPKACRGSTIDVAGRIDRHERSGPLRLRPFFEPGPIESGVLTG